MARRLSRLQHGGRDTPYDRRMHPWFWLFPVAMTLTVFGLAGWVQWDKRHRGE